MKDIIIIGTTNFSSLIYELIIQEKKANVVAFTTYKDYKDIDIFNGLPVVAFEDLELEYDMSKIYLLNTIGYSHMNAIREKVYKDCISKQYNIYTYVSKKACVYSKIAEDSGCIIAPSVYIGPNVNLGISNIIMSNSSITHNIEIGNFNFIGAGTIIGGNVEIESNTFIGLNSTIKNGIVIARETIIGSGSNLLCSTNLGGVYVGNPAKQLLNKKSSEVKI